MDNNNDNQVETPGGILREQRKKLDLSTHEVAKRIHLDVKIVEAIENNDHENMPTPIYVRGYLRSYAKIVGSDAGQIIDLYNAGSPPPPPDILPEVKPPTQASSSDKPVKAFTYLISLGLVLLLLIWYQSHFVVETPKNTDKETKEIPTSINGVDTTFEVVVHPTGWETPDSEEPVQDIEPEETMISINETLNETLQLQTDDGEESLRILTTDDTNTQLNIDDTDTQTNIDVTDTQTNIDDTNTQLNIIESGSSDSIILSLTDDSWIEVYDFEDNRLFYNLGIAGNQYSINGKAPFRIQLGYSDGVTVTFNGKKFDQSPYSRNGIARFKLPVE